MGCFNLTCGLSQLSILHHQKVKLFILIGDEHQEKYIGSGVCYPDSFYKSPYFPITGLYNDYGALENIEEDYNTQIIVDCFKNRKLGFDKIILNDINENECNLTTIEDIIKAISCGKVSASCPMYKTVKPVSFMMVHDDIYKSALEIIRKHTNSWGKNHNEQEEKCRQEFIKAIRLNRSEIPSIQQLMRFEDIPWKMFETNGSHALIRNYESIMDAPLDDIEELSYRFKDSVLFARFLEDSRKMFIPQAGAGSQDVNYDLSIDFMKSSLKIAKSLDLKYQKCMEE